MTARCRLLFILLSCAIVFVGITSQLDGRGLHIISRTITLRLSPRYPGHKKRIRKRPYKIQLRHITMHWSVAANCDPFTMRKRKNTSLYTGFRKMDRLRINNGVCFCCVCYRIRCKCVDFRALRSQRF